MFVIEVVEDPQTWSECEREALEFLHIALPYSQTANPQKLVRGAMHPVEFEELGKVLADWIAHCREKHPKVIEVWHRKQDATWN